ncbi:MAG: glutathione-disulfide reductase [Pseudobdellovibrionaceae bacterium]
MSTHYYDYDYFVIGAGSGGVRSARIAAQHGAKVGIAEGSRLGGTCVNLGCVPKKLLAYGSDFGFLLEDAGGYGWSVKETSFDWCKLMGNKDKELERLNNAYRKTLENAGVTLYPAFAHFIDAHTLQVGDQKITADKILIATGGTPNRLHIPGGEHAAVSDDMFSLEDWPQKAVIIGGGYIAVEFAHILCGLGVEVDLLVRGNMILRGFDDDLRLGLAKAMQDSHIRIHYECAPSEIQRNHKDGMPPYHVKTDKGTAIDCDLVLSAIGRSPNTESLNLNNVGIETARGGTIPVNEKYQTSVPHIYAVGDVTDTVQLTPVAIQEGHVLADHLFGPHTERRVDYRDIPTAVFSHPPIGTCGLTEDEAKAQGFDYEIYRTEFTPMYNQMTSRKEKTMMKLVVDKTTDRVIGLHILGKDAPEMLQGFAVAMKAGATKAMFNATIPIHPTSAEELVTMRTPVVKAEA